MGVWLDYSDSIARLERESTPHLLAISLRYNKERPNVGMSKLLSFKNHFIEIRGKGQKNTNKRTLHGKVFTCQHILLL